MARHGARLALTFVIALVAAGCTRPSAPALPEDEATVEMRDNAFSPALLSVTPGTTVTWINRDAAGHTVTPYDPEAWGTAGSGKAPDEWLLSGDPWNFTFTKPGTYRYYCAPHASSDGAGGFRGMTGVIVVSEAEADESVDRTVVPSALAPARSMPDEDGVVRFSLVATEVTAQVADGAAYRFWTFNGTVPGPMLRVREGDVVEVRLENEAASANPHSIDLHAVTGPGGGAAATQVDPGKTASFRFRATHPGLYVYHCATPHVPTHIANGMYGLIYVEPKEGIEPADREYYVVQGEAYTVQPVGALGLVDFSYQKLKDDAPEYVLFNGRVGALTGEDALRARVNETVRIFFGVGGAVPSSFHVIGEVFDRVWLDGETRPSDHRQTVLVPAAGSAVLEFRVDHPGTYVLVDHTLSHAFDRGAAGHLIVDGPADASLYEPGAPPT